MTEEHINEKDDANDDEKQGESDNNNNNHDGDGDDGGGGSLLALALARSESVQVVRVSHRDENGSGGGVGAFLNFFGQGVKDDIDIGVTAEPASLQNLQNLRREARARREESQGLTKTASEFSAPKEGKKKGKMRRNHTITDPRAERSTSLAKWGMSAATTPLAAKAQLKASEQGGTSRMKKSNTIASSRVDRSTILASMGVSLPSSAASTSTSTSLNPTNTRRDLGEHGETVQRLKVQDDDIQKLLQDPRAFGKLQKVLRKHGAVTNEVLRQVLPLYVKSQVNSEAAKQAQRLQNEKKTTKTPGSRPRKDTKHQQEATSETIPVVDGAETNTQS